MTDGRIERRRWLCKHRLMHKPTGQEFYARLMEALKDSGLPTSQTSVAQFLGVHQSAVAKWKSGESFPTFENAQKLAQRASVAVNWLYLGLGNKKQENDMDEQTVALLKAWDRMPETARSELLEYVRYRAAQIERSESDDESDKKH